MPKIETMLRPVPIDQRLSEENTYALDLYVTEGELEQYPDDKHPCLMCQALTHGMIISMEQPCCSTECYDLLIADMRRDAQQSDRTARERLASRTRQQLCDLYRMHIRKKYENTDAVSVPEDIEVSLGSGDPGAFVQVWEWVPLSDIVKPEWFSLEGANRVNLPEEKLITPGDAKLLWSYFEADDFSWSNLWNPESIGRLIEAGFLQETTSDRFEITAEGKEFYQMLVNFEQYPDI